MASSPELWFYFGSVKLNVIMFPTWHSFYRTTLNLVTIVMIRSSNYTTSYIRQKAEDMSIMPITDRLWWRAENRAWATRETLLQLLSSSSSDLGEEVQTTTRVCFWFCCLLVPSLLVLLSKGLWANLKGMLRQVMMSSSETEELDLILEDIFLLRKLLVRLIPKAKTSRGNHLNCDWFIKTHMLMA